MKLLILNIAVILLVINCSAAVDQDNKIVRARIDSCPGCSLNRLKEVRAFIYDDVPKYENVEWKKIPGAPPELVLFNEADEEIERLPLKNLNREECNNLLKSKGFNLKQEKEL